MNIVYASNDGYARHLAVSLYSMLEHNADAKELIVYVLSAGMSREYQDRLKQIGAEFGRTLTVIELGDLKERFDYQIDTRGFDISAMTRLFSAGVLPSEVKKALYLDCDTVVLGSLKGLWETDLAGNLVGMVMEPTVYTEIKAAIDLQQKEAYYNSGVLLMDLDGWRREQVQNQFMEFYSRKNGQLFACDQDTLNGVLKGRIKTIPPKYNFFTNYRYFRYETLVHATEAYREVAKEEFEEARRRPAVIHYMGDERPWVAGNRNYYRKYYEYYLERTPWKGTPKETGKELYMLLYFAMNQVTRICPPVRKWISKRFGMKIIDSRKKK
ncbi:MAG: glycosyltransferase family 8 protein [Clostridiaceae bacterium]|nr:glycosyltransferase family 8 protein [Clostridiaceae bacterium]